MLILKRAKKAEAIIRLLQSYFEELSASNGMFDRKEDIVLYHSMNDYSLFNVVSGYSEPENVLNIAALLELARSQGYPFLWLAHSSNKNLNQYLLKHGLSERGDIRALYFNMRDCQAKFEAHPAVDFVPVVNIEQFYEWCHIFSECYGIPQDIVESYFKSSFKEGEPCLYLASLYQKAIGCSALHIEGQSALLLWDSVLPMYRRQGVGSMMILSRMQVARDSGLDHIYSFAMDPMLEVYTELGFNTFAKFNILRYDPRLPSSSNNDET